MLTIGDRLRTRVRAAFLRSWEVGRELTLYAGAGGETCALVFAQFLAEMSWVQMVP